MPLLLALSFESVEDVIENLPPLIISISLHACQLTCLLTGSVLGKGKVRKRNLSIASFMIGIVWPREW